MRKVKVVSDTDFVHDVSYSFYGDQMAVCTSSQSIGIWRRSTDNEWAEVHRISHAHSGPIWRLDWAHPEFGTVIASCSEDRTVSIFSCGKGDASWRKRATLTDSAHAVTDVQFAPRQFGLKLAACSADGMVRVYEASDVLNLSVWDVEDVPVSALGACSALSWSSSERLAVVGSAGRLGIYERKSNRWTLLAATQASPLPLKDCAWAPNLCREADWIATCGDTVIVWALKGEELVPVHTIECGTGPIWRCAWSLTGDVLSLAPETGKVQVWQLAGIANSTCFVVKD